MAPMADAASVRQYYEMFGSRALVAEQDGRWFKAVTRHIRGHDFDDDRWELYDLSVDFSECRDLAEDQPDKLEELIGLWWEEAERHGVLPNHQGCRRRRSYLGHGERQRRDIGSCFPGVGALRGLIPIHRRDP